MLSRIWSYVLAAQDWLLKTMDEPIIGARLVDPAPSIQVPREIDFLAEHSESRGRSV